MSFTRTLLITLVGLCCTFSGGGLYAQSFWEQNTWETLPVFHNGRVMPLHTFARQIVREICGTERPFIVRDDAVIAEFNAVTEAFQQQRQDDLELEEAAAGYRFLNPGTSFDGGFERTYSRFNLAGESQPVRAVLPVRGRNPQRIEHLANRIRQLVPAEGKYFEADELLLAWICEPEVWTYIPLFLVPETEYLDEVFDLPFEGSVRTSQQRISLYQLEGSQRYKLRLDSIHRRHEHGQRTRDPIPFDIITERLESQSLAFRELTFHPQRQRPTRMLSLLYQTAGLTSEQSSYVSAFQAWARLLAIGDVPGRQVTERLSDSDVLTVLHPTTQRWHDITDKMRFLMQIYDRSDPSTGNPVLPRAVMVEQQYEILIDLLDTNLAEAAALMESVYPGITYRPEGDDRVINAARLLPRLGLPENQQHQAVIRQTVVQYYYAVKKMRQEIEAAYLALYDNGRSFRFLPVLSPLVLEMASSQDNVGVQPWASAAMILGSGRMFVKRFFDPQIAPSAAGPSVLGEPNETINREEDVFSPIPDENNSDEINDPDADLAMETPLDAASEEHEAAIITDVPPMDTSVDPTDPAFIEQLFQQFDMENGILLLGADSQSLIAPIRNSLNAVLSSYSSEAGRQYGGTDFILRAELFQEKVRQAAMQVETQRKSFADPENQLPENQLVVEHLTKTAYPISERKLLAEYRYDRLRPFYWMGFFALLALLINSGAYAAAATRGQSGVEKTITIVSTGKEGREKETELSDYTNTVEEWLFFGSVVLLMLAILIALIGAVMRASITGWAPVTNMYETVVMMAFAAAVIGVWYALHPLLQPALRQAWLYSQFPRIGTLLEWITAVKAQKTVAHRETAGEAAMREVATEFGVPGGVTLGGQPIIAQLSPEELEARQRVKAVRRKFTGQCLLAVPRLILTLLTLYLIVLMANGEYAAEHGLYAAAVNMFEATDIVDLLAVIVSVFLMIWIVPHTLLTLIIALVLLFRPAWIAAELGIHSFESIIIVEQAQQSRVTATGYPRSEMASVFHGEGHGAFKGSQDTSGTAWLKQARNAVLERKLFIAITAGLVFVVALIASLNRTEFNPDIRPIAAVLRSNFWLAVHVIAIVVSYAAAFIAWGMATVSLGYVVFGHYRRIEPAFEGQRRQVLLPEQCQLFSSAIERLIRIALLLLIVGTVLGARWADYSWGRFWSWDPKEVWALITIVFFVIVFHGKAARYYGVIGITVGALFASIAVIITWYGINFVFISSEGRHTYGGGQASNAAIFLGLFIAANLLWGTLALLRYNAEVYGSETAE